jgi:cell division transport system ATP-binding protein
MRYGRAAEVLKDVNFALAPGSFHFLTGASGAGKSSLLKLIYLAERPSRGSIELFGRDVEAVAAADRPFLRRRIGVVFQEFRLLDHLSAFDNVALPLRIAGGKPDDYRADVAELLTWVGLKARMHALPPTLSGGEKQRLAIARAVVNRPDILLADEPTGNVDDAHALRILKLFVELNRLGATVLIASHDEDLVARSGQPVLHLDNGRLRAFGRNVRTEPQ